MIYAAVVTATTLVGLGFVVAGRSQPAPIPVRVRTRRRRRPAR